MAFWGDLQRNPYLENYPCVGMKECFVSFFTSGSRDVLGLGFRVQGMGVYGLGFWAVKVKGLGFSGLGVWGSGYGDLGI